VTVFLGGGFAAKYLRGVVPLQWMIGLRRLKLDAFWLAHLPSEGNTRDDERKIDNFRRQLRAHGLGGRYCLLYHKTPDSVHDLEAIRCIGMSKGEVLDRLAGPNIQGTTPTPAASSFLEEGSREEKAAPFVSWHLRLF
jgi:hypothetical protein